ncbi:HYOU1_1 [Blepharisma stoltei]|uniref:Uncharacterized protein n=1 Tax=Blepharisma stoltei TaxID=1481888 RepID=A0AAU9I800_9CILI|nr:unnamed protein product [Blepharisma stoltei]
MYFLALFLLSYFASGAVIGIDFGTELIKTSIIQPGRKLGAIESPQSKRMIHNIVALQGEHHLLGEEATNYMQKDPQSALIFTTRALGKAFNDTDLQKRFLNEFIPLEVSEDSSRFSIEFKIKNEKFSVEETAAMVLEFIRKLADKTSGDSARDCVITVPNFWTVPQRRSLLVAAEAAKLNVMSLISDNTGAALYYGIDRFDNKTDHKILIYNLGASYLQVSIVRYFAALKKASKLSAKQVETIEILANTWDSEFGGRTIDAEIAEYLNEKFIASGGSDVKDNVKAMSKLLHAANQAKKTLSASKTSYVNVPNIIPGHDFTFTLEREIIENIVEKHTERLIKPIQNALDTAKLTIDDINFIEILGGPIRIPKIQEIIEKKFKQPQTHLNGDESMAQGAAIYAANFSSEVMVKPLWLIEKTSLPIKAVFTSPSNKEFNKEKILFESGSVLGQTKKIGFTIENDVECVFSYQKNNEWVPFSLYSVTGNQERYGKAPQVIFVFSLDYSGIPKLDSAEAKYEIEVEVEIKKSVNETEAQKKPENETEAQKIPENETEAQKKPENETVAQTVTEKVKKNKIIKQELNIKQLEFGNPLPPKKDLAKIIKEKLDAYTVAEEERKQLAHNRNELESYIYFIQEKLEGSEFLRVISPDDLSTLKIQINETLHWLESGDYKKQGSSGLIKEKTKLEKMTAKFLDRETELMSREDKILDGYLKLQELYREMSYLNKTKTWIPLPEKEKVFMVINETIEWLDQKVEEQKNTPEWEEPVLKIAVLESKVKGVEKRVEIIKKTGRPRQEYKEQNDKKTEENQQPSEAAQEKAPEEAKKSDEEANSQADAKTGETSQPAEDSQKEPKTDL